MKFFVISMYIALIDFIVIYAAYEFLNYLVQLTNNESLYVLWVLVLGFAGFNIIYLTDKLIENEQK